MLVINNGTVAIGAGVSVIASESKGTGSQRLVLEITNLNAVGGNDVYVAVGEEAAASKGRIIKPQASIVWSTDGGYRPPNERVFAYSAGATNLAVYEEVAVRE